jgi:AcrR family transcriptional regulator
VTPSPADLDDPPRPPGRAAALPPEERRSMIVQATLPLLLEHGEMVTTRQIAQAAGIAEGTIFRAFPDKDALLDAVVEAAYDTGRLDDAIAAIPLDQPFEAALRAAIEILQRRVVEVWRIASSVGPRRHPARQPVTVSEPLVALFTAYRSELRLEPDDAARLLRGLTLALTHPSLIEEPMAPAALIDRFLHGTAAETP